MKQSNNSALAGLASVALGGLGNMGAVYGLNKLIAREGMELSHTSPQRVQSLLDIVRNKHGIDVGYIHDPYIVGTNAGYATPDMMERSIGDIEEGLNKPTSHDPSSTAYIHPSERRALIRRVDDLKKSMRRSGIIITGKHFKKPGTIEHELGHAIAANKGNVVERALIKYDVPGWSTFYHTIPSYIAALVGGSKSPLTGMLAGGLTGLATDIPALYTEYSANKYGDELLDKDAPQHSKYKSYGTYLSNAILPFLITGGIYGLSKKKLGL